MEGNAGIGTTSASARLDVRGGNWQTPAIWSQGGLYVHGNTPPTHSTGPVVRAQNEWGRGHTNLIEVGFYIPESVHRHDGITRINSWRRSDVAVAPWCPVNAARDACYQTKLNFLDVGENGIYTPREAVVGGSMSVGKTDSPGERLDVSGNIRATSTIYTTNDANYLHPSCEGRGGSWACISTYVFTSQHYYGHDSNTSIYIGQSGNTVRIRGSIDNPDGELRINDVLRVNNTIHADNQLHMHSWDSVVHTNYGGYQHDLIGYYHGWDKQAIYIAGYRRDTRRVIVGHSGGTVDLHVSGDIYARGQKIGGAGIGGNRIQAVSVGCDAPGTCGYVRLYEGGRNRAPGGRGFQCMTLNRATGEYIDRGSFDTCCSGWSGDNNLYSWLHARRTSSRILVCAIQDEGGNQLRSRTRDLLRGFGAHKVHHIGWRNAYVLIGRWGYEPGEAFECREASSSGSCRIAVNHTDIW